MAIHRNPFLDYPAGEAITKFAHKDSGSEASQQGSEADQPDTATSLNNINLVPIKPAPRKEKLRPSQSSTSCEPPSAVEMTAP